MNNNPDGNPDIVEHGKLTQFGQPGGADPREARAAVKVNPTSIRSCLRRLMAYPFNPSEPLNDQIRPQRLMEFLGHGHASPTLAMMAAIQTYRHGIESGKIMMQLIDQVDGKLIEKTITTTTTLEQLVTGDYPNGEQPAE